MEKIGKTKLWIEEAWAPRLQQVNGKPIMERIVRLKRVTKCKLKQVNVVRVWMRVETVADIANEAEPASWITLCAANGGHGPT